MIIIVKITLVIVMMKNITNNNIYNYNDNYNDKAVVS